MRYDPIDKQLFIKNRDKLLNKMEANSLALVNANDQMPRNGDQFYPFRQQSDLFYLTGIEQEKTMLLLCPNHKNPKNREILVLLKPNPKLEIWEGHKLTKTEARSISGIENVVWLEEMDTLLKDMVLGVEKVYLNANEYPKFYSEIVSRDKRFGARLKEKYPYHNYYRLAPLITKLRMQKEKEEVELLNTAIHITDKAFSEILKMIKPGIYEYEIEAEMTSVFIKNKAKGHAYQPIIASGINACALHYTENNKQCKDGELVLMDFGAEYANYAADCTRTIPVNGKFTHRQKQVYQSVLDVLKKAMKLMKPGNTINKLNKEVNQLVEKELIKLGLLTEEDIKNQDEENPACSRYFMHGTSHFIGLDVHDVGSKDEPFKPGMVLSCEPAIYIEDENMGIRLENDILITENGQINLMEKIPIEMDEIERIMNK